MSTSERPLVLTRSTTHQQQRLSTELAITTSSGSLPSSTHATTVTTKSASVTFQKPFSNFIDIIVAAFTALLLAWRLLLPKSDEVAVDLSGKKDHHGSSLKDIGGISASAVSTTTSVAATAMESVPSIESLRALLSTDDQLVTTGHQQPFLTEAQFVTQCSSSQDIEYFLRYGTNTYNTERCLLSIPELDILPTNMTEGCRCVTDILS